MLTKYFVVTNLRNQSAHASEVNVDFDLEKCWKCLKMRSEEGKHTHTHTQTDRDRHARINAISF